MVSMTEDAPEAEVTEISVLIVLPLQGEEGGGAEDW